MISAANQTASIIYFRSFIVSFPASLFVYESLIRPQSSVYLDLVADSGSHGCFRLLLASLVHRILDFFGGVDVSMPPKIHGRVQ